MCKLIKNLPINCRHTRGSQYPAKTDSVGVDLKRYTVALTLFAPLLSTALDVVNAPFNLVGNKALFCTGKQL